jgi:hypothetical protein
MRTRVGHRHAPNVLHQRSSIKKTRTSEQKKVEQLGPFKWEHIQFYLRPEGVAADVTFTNIKGNMAAAFTSSEQSRVFSLLPTKGHRLHLDVTALPYAMACAWNMCIYTPQQLANLDSSSQRVRLPLHDWAQSTVVFVHPDDPDKPLTHYLFCWLLQGMYINANLFGRYGPYSWRRGDLTTLMQRKDTTFV